MYSKKILVIATTFPRWKNDTTPRFVYDLSDSLASKYNITVLAPHHKGATKKEKLGKVEVRRFAYFKPESLQKLCYGGGIIPNMKTSFLARVQLPLLVFSEFIFSYRLMKREKINMVHAHWILPQGFIGALLKKIFKVPLLVTIHGSDLFPLKSKLFRKMQKFVAGNADVITVNSTATKNELVKRFPEFTSKIKLIPMGVDTNLFTKKKLKKPRKYAKNKLLLTVGRLTVQKGLQYLIDSLPDLVAYDPALKLLVIGTGPYEQSLKDRVIAKNLQNNVEFLGSLSSESVARYQNYADIFVMPSLAHKTGTEALGLSILEAMASGSAVIGTRVGGLSFIIKDGKNGLLVRQRDPHDLARAVIALLKNKKKRVKLGSNASRFVRKNYSWDIVSKKFMKLYKELLR